MNAPNEHEEHTRPADPAVPDNESAEQTLLEAEKLPYRPEITRRVWLLMLLDGTERSGITPLPSARLHQLAFFANCLSPVYDLAVPDGKILKYRRGPFYPAVQWDIDRLVAQGLVSMSDVQHITDDFGAWFSASYAINEASVTALDVALESARAMRAYTFLIELAAAYASLGDEARKTAAFQDATFGDPHALGDSLIDFAEWSRRNYSEETAEAFGSLVPESRVGNRDKLHLYFRYLDRMVLRETA